MQRRTFGVLKYEVNDCIITGGGQNKGVYNNNLVKNIFMFCGNSETSLIKQEVKHHIFVCKYKW